MSKHPDGDLPPSYNEATTTTTSPPTYTNAHQTSVSATLTNLSSLLRETQAQQSALDTLATTALLPLLTPHLTSLLTRLGTTPHPPALAELVFVPAAAVAPGWSVASDADRRAGEVVQVVRVEPQPDPDSKGGSSGDKKTSSSSASKYDTALESSYSSSREFDDWGRWDDDVDAAGPSDAGDRWWWDDEGLARRLARQLQPEPKVDRTVVRAVVEHAREEKKAARWGLFKSANEPTSSSSSSAPAPPQQQFASRSSAPPKQDEDVSMTVRAEEVTFRKENEMGIWESTRGWGIVARVRIRR